MEEMVFSPLEWLILALILLALIFSFYLINKVGKGTLRVPFIHFTVGILLVGASQIFLFLRGGNHESVSTHIWWHLVFYLALISFAWASKRLREISDSPISGFYSTSDWYVSGLLLALAAVVWVVSEPLNHMLDMLLAGSIIERYGLYHFVVVVIAGITIFYVAGVQQIWRRIMGISIFPIIIFLALMSLEHVWAAFEHLTTVHHEGMESMISESFTSTPGEVIAILGLVSLLFGLFQMVLALNKKV